ncbi:hypothetical protein J6590_035135 [Homalodisca vitripennis]|nr:hypothetical protein J6590_035135 [Homalodisca vitripennis]
MAAQRSLAGHSVQSANRSTTSAKQALPGRRGRFFLIFDHRLTRMYGTAEEASLCDSVSILRLGTCHSYLVSAYYRCKTCFLCKKVYHLDCIGTLTDDDFQYIVSSNVNWKCSECDTKKAVRDDNTPVTPVSEKAVFFQTQKHSDSDVGSDSSNISKTGIRRKIVCKKCAKGFSHNSCRPVCSECGENYHFKCTSISKQDYEKNQPWLCPVCAGESGLNLSVATQEAAADKIKSTDILDLMNEMRDFRREMKEINIDFKNNMEKYSEWIIDNGNKIEEVGKQVRGIKEDISHLYQENINLRKTVQELTNKTNFLEQASKENVIEINGIPSKDKEDLLDLISRVAAAIGFEFQVNMIDNCYRYRTVVRADGRPGGIVVRFIRKLDLEQFIQKRKDKRNLNTRDIGFMEGQSNPIYVNNSLTQANRKLLNTAREVKREKQYTYL